MGISVKPVKCLNYNVKEYAFIRFFRELETT